MLHSGAVPFRRQALSQDRASRSTRHDWDPSEDVLFPMPGSNYRQDGSDELCVAEAAGVCGAGGDDDRASIVAIVAHATVLERRANSDGREARSSSSDRHMVALAVRRGGVDRPEGMRVSLRLQSFSPSGAQVVVADHDAHHRDIRVKHITVQVIPQKPHCTLLGGNAVLFRLPGSNYRPDGLDECCVAEAAGGDDGLHEILVGDTGQHVQVRIEPSSADGGSDGAVSV